MQGLRGRVGLAALVGFLLGSLLTVPVHTQGPFTAQVQRALNAFLGQAHTWTGAQTFSGGTSSTGQFLAGDGTAAAPSYSFTAQPEFGLWREAANVLSLSGGTNAQILRIYNTYTDASNYARTEIGWAGNTFKIVIAGAGTGAVARDLYTQTAGTLVLAGGVTAIDNAAGSVNYWNFSGTTGHFTAGADNTYDIGATGATRPRNGYFGTSVVSPSFQGSGTGTSVANVGANSCGTSAATIAGNQTSGVITVGTVAGTQCRVTFSTAAPVARDCIVTDSTTTIATRATVVDTTNTDFLGAFVAGDKITYVCVVR